MKLDLPTLQATLYFATASLAIVAAAVALTGVPW